MMVDKNLEDSIMAALAEVQEPELHKDLVTLNMIQDLDVDGDQVSFTIMLTTPACPLKNQIENDARQAVLGVPGIGSVDIFLPSHCWLCSWRYAAFIRSTLYLLFPGLFPAEPDLSSSDWRSRLV